MFYSRWTEENVPKFKRRKVNIGIKAKYHNMCMLHDPAVAAACYDPMLGSVTHILSRQVKKYPWNNKCAVKSVCVLHVKMLFNTV